MGETATLEQKIPKGFVLSKSLDLYLTNKGLTNSETIERLAEKLGVKYKVNRTGRIVGITHSDALKLAGSLGFNLVSNREFLSYRAEFKELTEGNISPYGWISDVYDFESGREDIDVYLNPVFFDEKRRIYLEASGEPVKPIKIIRAQARAIRNGYGKYIISYDENGIPIDFTDREGLHNGDRFWSSPVGIKAALRGWKKYARTGVEEFLSLRNPIGRNNDGGKIVVYTKIPTQS